MNPDLVSKPIRRLLDSFWRALLYCLMPRTLLLSMLPLLLMVVLAWVLAYFFWQSSIDAVRVALDSSHTLELVRNGLRRFGIDHFQNVIAPLLVVLLATPLLVVSVLTVTALLMTPALTAWVARRRFGHLARLHGGSLVGGLFWSLGSMLVAFLVLVVSLPFWLLPPVGLLVPPLAWGWLTYRVMVYDVLAVHASVDERRQIMRQHRWPLLCMGWITGYLGTLPALLWASGAVFVAAFLWLAPMLVWIYTVVFAFSSLWFAHYALAALAQMRADGAAPAPEAAPPLLPLEGKNHAP